VCQFISIVGVTDADVAKNYLEACGGNLDLAVSMHMDSNGAVAEASPLAYFLFANLLIFYFT